MEQCIVIHFNFVHYFSYCLLFVFNIQYILISNKVYAEFHWLKVLYNLLNIVSTEVLKKIIIVYYNYVHNFLHN